MLSSFECEYFEIQGYEDSVHLFNEFLFSFKSLKTLIMVLRTSSRLNEMAVVNHAPILETLVLEYSEPHEEDTNALSRICQSCPRLEYVFAPLVLLGYELQQEWSSSHVLLVGRVLSRFLQAMSPYWNTGNSVATSATAYNSSSSNPLPRGQ